MNDTGRPKYEDKQYKEWLNLITPFLVAGNSLNYAIIKCGLYKHKTTLYEKLRLNDWFSEKVHDFQSIPGELVNETFYILVRQIHKKVKAGEELSDKQISLLKYFSERHKSCQPFFTNKQEIIQSDPNRIKEVIDNLEKEDLTTDYADIARRAGEKLKEITN